MTASPAADAPLIFLIAGEPSGDQLGALLMRALKRETEGQLRFAGIGGPQMEGEGLKSLFPLSDFAVMGLLEVLPHVAKIYQRIKATVAAVETARPAVVVTIDSPGFTLRVSKRLRGKGIPLVHYVAPSVWAWKAWRAKQVAGYLDRLLALLPFEPPYFEVHGLKTKFVGHPVVELGPGSGAERTALGAAFRERHGMTREDVVLCLLPGSRRGEVARLLPIFQEVMERVTPAMPGLRLVLPTVPTVADLVEDAVGSWGQPVQVIRDPAEKQAVFAASDLALAASGTVAVELAVAGVPAVIAYKVNALSAQVAKRLLKIRFVSLPNILLGRALQPELLQWDCTPDKIAAELRRLFDDPEVRQSQLDGYQEMTAKLKPDDGPPSRSAALEILSLIRPSEPI